MRDAPLGFRVGVNGGLGTTSAESEQEAGAGRTNRHGDVLRWASASLERGSYRDRYGGMASAVEPLGYFYRVTTCPGS